MVGLFYLVETAMPEQHISPDNECPGLRRRRSPSRAVDSLGCEGSRRPLKPEDLFLGITRSSGLPRPLPSRRDRLLRAETAFVGVAASSERGSVADIDGGAGDGVDIGGGGVKGDQREVHLAGFLTVDIAP